MTIVTGLPVDRRDGRLKVTGRAKYAAEFDIANTAHAVLVQSTITSGRIAGFELAAAQSVPGVLAILTPDNAPRFAQIEPAGQTVSIPLLQDNQVYYNGQHIAVVVGDTLERAQYAASLVKASYQEGEAAIRMEEALAEAYRRSVFAMARGRQTAAAVTRKRPSPQPQCGSHSRTGQ